MLKAKDYREKAREALKGKWVQAKEIKDEDIEGLAKTALKEGNPLYPVPVLMDKERFKEIYLKIKIRTNWKWKRVNLIYYMSK